MANETWIDRPWTGETELGPGLGAAELPKTPEAATSATLSDAEPESRMDSATDSEAKSDPESDPEPAPSDSPESDSSDSTLEASEPDASSSEPTFMFAFFAAAL